MSATAVPAARPAEARSRPSFLGAFRGELLKLGRQRTLWALLIGGILLLLLVSATFLGNDALKQRYLTSHSQFFVQAFGVLGDLFAIGAAIVLLISSSRLFGMEYAGGTIRVLLARGLGRIELYFAKVLALLVLGLVLFAGYAALAAGLLAISIASWSGGKDGLLPLDSVSSELLAWVVLYGWTSIGVAILLGSAAAIVGRSLAFGVGVAMGFFPADNFGTLILQILTRITRQDFFARISDYLLGPNLNMLVPLAKPSLQLRPAFASPFDQVSLGHVETVIAVYAAVFFLVGVILIARRDVLE